MQSKMRKLISHLLVASLIGFATANNVYGQDSQYIEKNQPAPYTGILFTEKKAQSIRDELLDKDKLQIQYDTEKHRSERLGEIIKLKDEEIDLYNQQNKRLMRVNNRSDTLNYIWFGLGVIVTGVAVYGAGGLAR